MPRMNNSAGRLYIILDKFRANEDNVKVDKAWADIFGLKPADVSDLSLAISEVVKLIEEVKLQIAVQDVDLEIYMKPFAKIERIFTLGFGHKLANARVFIDDTVMAGLEFCAELLSRKMGEEVIEEEKLDDLFENINLLNERIAESDLPRDLKVLLQTNLYRLKKAVQHYHVHGARGLKDALDIALGSTWAYSQQHQTETDKDVKEIIKQYLGILFLGMSVVADAYTLLQITAPHVEKFLPLIQ